MGPRHAADLADYVLSAGGSLTTLRCGSNPGMVGELDRHGRLKTPDVHIESFRQLCEALKPSQVTEVDFSGCGLGPLGAGCVADYVRNAIAAIKSIVLDGCEITGSKIKYKGESYEQIEQLDADLSGFTSLCSALGSSQIATISLRKCYLGPQAIALLADSIKVMAAIASLSIAGAFTPAMDYLVTLLPPITRLSCNLGWA